jgi:hypothetical protein
VPSPAAFSTFGTESVSLPKTVATSLARSTPTVALFTL